MTDNVIPLYGTSPAMLALSQVRAANREKADLLFEPWVLEKGYEPPGEDERSLAFCILMANAWCALGEHIRKKIADRQPTDDIPPAA